MIVCVIEEIIDNNRYETKTFAVEQDSILHGFSGYFKAVLYDNITLSIEPSTHSPEMFSWFPIFFPIKVSLTKKKNIDIFIILSQCSESILFLLYTFIFKIIIRS